MPKARKSRRRIDPVRVADAAQHLVGGAPQSRGPCLVPGICGLLSTVALMKGSISMPWGIQTWGQRNPARDGASASVSVWNFRGAALPEVLDGTVNSNPVMFRLLKNRYDGGRVFWVRH